MMYTRTAFLFVIYYFVSCLSVCFGQQTINQVSYNGEKGYYVIRYYWNGEPDSIYKGTVMPGNNVNPSVSATVSRVEGSLFKYSYRVKNEEDALYPLYSFKFKINFPVKDIQVPSRQWWGSYLEWKSLLSWSKTGGEIVGIKAGETVDGFSYISPVFPSIVNSLSSNYTWSSFSEEEEGPIGRLEIVVDSLISNKKYVEVKTIGPRKLPDNISNAALLDTLQSYLTFSCDTTWIENNGICRSLEVKLDNVEKQLQSGNKKTASNNLQALLNELNALKKKQISSEAYALLYYNGEYLLNKLQPTED